MKFLQKLGKALMLPVACLPICGILMGIGYALCPATMQGGDITGIGNQIGFFLVKAGGALIDNMALLFVIGVGVGMAEKHDGTGGMAALASWLMITNLLSTAVVTTIMPSIAKNADATLAFDKISNPFIGILAGVILAVGRIVGESAALLFTAGFGTVLYSFGEALNNSSATLTVALYLYANERGRTDIAFAIAAILMILTLVINLSASLVGRKLKK